ncbi:exocyst complex component 3-like protein [Strigops habroptila]|uniref:exocyst complex component 3-like protein n=1 Tax=Strigops habroptila TaxID=2489341 RepID=UPI0011CFD6A8|nr:exocyst complex component 3-like protein [Strigops habroptila]
MGLSAEDERAASPGDEEWPEAEKAEKLARGAALKWASGVFYRPEKLERLGQYRSREMQRNSSIQSRLKLTLLPWSPKVMPISQRCMSRSCCWSGFLRAGWDGVIAEGLGPLSSPTWRG